MMISLMSSSEKRSNLLIHCFMSYLFGSIITVPVADLYALAGLDVVLLLVTLRHYNGFVSMKSNGCVLASRTACTRPRRRCPGWL